MILKFRCSAGIWRFIDEIDTADVMQGTEDAPRAIRYSRNGETCTQPLESDAFLLNDRGKTIERLDVCIL